MAIAIPVTTNRACPSADCPLLRLLKATPYDRRTLVRKLSAQVAQPIVQPVQAVPVGAVQAVPMQVQVLAPLCTGRLVARSPYVVHADTQDDTRHRSCLRKPAQSCCSEREPCHRAMPKALVQTHMCIEMFVDMREGAMKICGSGTTVWAITIYTT